MKLSGLKIGPTREEPSTNSALGISELPSARYGGAIAMLHVCGTSEVHKQGAPEVHFTSQRCMTYVPAV
jgi:hypothetical protein